MQTSRILSIGILSSAVALTGCIMPTTNGGTTNAGLIPNNHSTAVAGINSPFNGFGHITNVQMVQANSGGTTQVGKGALIGGLAGGVIGNRIGDKKDEQTAGALAGAAIGALIGHVIEQQAYGRYYGKPVYRVTVRGNDGIHRSYDYPQNPNVRIGERVQIQGTKLYRAQ